MAQLVVTIDGAKYRIEGSGGAEAALAEFQRLMQAGALDELPLAGGRRMLVNWGRVTAVSVAEDDREDELSLSGQGTEPHWPERPF